MTTRDHDRLAEDAAAYALGALEPAERDRFEAHLAECEDCRAEVARLSPAVAAMAEAVEPAEPPASLKRSLMAEVEPRPEPRRAPRRLRFRPAVAWAAAALLLVGVAGFGLGRASDGDDARTLSVRVDQDALPGASGTLTVLDDGAVLALEELPQPPRGRAYQAWLERDGRIVPQPTFRPAPGGSGSVALTGDLDGVDQVLLTREPLGGSREPSERPVSSVAL